MSDDYEPMLKKPEILRDQQGRFDRHGRELAKTSKNTMNNGNLVDNREETKSNWGGYREGSGRPVGSKNKIPLQLKEMILRALDKVGGEEYLAKLAIENSSAFASLLGKVLPSTLQMPESDGGASNVITFRRIIVLPGGREHVEGETPLALPPPLPQKDKDEIVVSDQDIDD